MTDFQLLGASPWRATPAQYTFTSHELICNDNGTIHRFFFDDIRKVQLSHHYDWRLRHFFRCRIHVAGRGRTQLHSDVTEASERALHGFFHDLVSHVAKVNPKLKILHGIDHVKWAVLVAAHFGIAAICFLFASRAPREPFFSLVIAVVMGTYLFVSLIATFMNWPHYVLPESETGIFRGQGMHGYLADQYERYISPLLDLGTFLLNPSSLANGIASRDKKSFRLALSGLGFTFFLLEVVAHALVWGFSLQSELKFYEAVAIQAGLLIVPAGCFAFSFLFLRVMLKYEDLNPSQYLHSFLYAASLIVMVEIAAGVAVMFVEHTILDYSPDWLSHIPPPYSVNCGNVPPSDCELGKQFYAAIQKERRASIEAGIIVAAFMFWILTLFRFARLTNIVFHIKYLHGHLANFSALILVLSLFYFLISNLAGGVDGR
jgi:hypothetical protein